MKLIDLLHDHATSMPDTCAFVASSSGEKMTYGELWQRSGAIAAALLEDARDADEGAGESAPSVKAPVVVYGHEVAFDAGGVRRLPARGPRLRARRLAFRPRRARGINRLADPRSIWQRHRACNRAAAPSCREGNQLRGWSNGACEHRGRRGRRRGGPGTWRVGRGPRLRHLHLRLHRRPQGRRGHRVLRGQLLPLGAVRGRR